MPQHKKKSNRYLQRFKQTRQIGSYNFDLDLRKVKDDSQLSKAQKSYITRVYNEFQLMAQRHQNESIKLIKPRKHKGETDAQYKRRFAKLRRENAPDYSYLNVIPLGVPKHSKYKIKDGKIIVTRKNFKMEEFFYSLEGDKKLNFIDDPKKVILETIKQHDDNNPQNKTKLIGVARMGYLWKLEGIMLDPTLSDVVDKIVDILLDYKEMDNQPDLSKFVSHIVIRG